MANETWTEIEALVSDLFTAGLTPERNELMGLAYEKNASDAVIDAFDTLGGRPVASLTELKELLSKAGAL